MRGIHRGPVNSPHKRPVTRKMFPFDDVIMGEMFLLLPAECLFWAHTFDCWPDEACALDNIFTITERKVSSLAELEAVILLKLSSN